MIHLGVDPGTTIIGYGLIDDSGGRLSPLTWGTIRNPGINFSADKVSTEKILSDLIKRWHPNQAAVEKLFFFNNKKSVMSVSEMRGVIMLTLTKHGLPTIELTPLQVKQQICGHGRAKKHQIQLMVRRILSIKEEIRPDDAADALALALCGATAQKRY